MTIIDTVMIADGYNVQNDVLLLAAKVSLLVSTEVDNFSLDDLDMYVSLPSCPLLHYTALSC